MPTSDKELTDFLERQLMDLEAQELTFQELLNEELRGFLAEQLGGLIFHPSHEAAIAAVQPYLPELVEETFFVEKMLDDCGLVAIADLGSRKHGTHERISFSVADNDEDAQKQLEKYGQPSYWAIRKALEIDHHWILRMDESFSSYNSNTLVEAHIAFECDHKKAEICIIELE